MIVAIIRYLRAHSRSDLHGPLINLIAISSMREGFITNDDETRFLLRKFDYVLNCRRLFRGIVLIASLILSSEKRFEITHQIESNRIESILWSNDLIIVPWAVRCSSARVPRDLILPKVFRQDVNIRSYHFHMLCVCHDSCAHTCNEPRILLHHYKTITKA